MLVESRICSKYSSMMPKDGLAGILTIVEVGDERQNNGFPNDARVLILDGLGVGVQGLDVYYVSRASIIPRSIS